MERRELLAGLGAFGVFGVGAATAFTNFDVTDIGSSGTDGGGANGIEPVDLPRFDAPGSTSGVETVPEPGRVTFLTFFATWCPICQDKMEPLGEAADRVDDDVQFVSVTNERLGTADVEREDVIDWWETYDGHWPVVHDEDLELTLAVDAGGVPYAVVFDDENRITWEDGGYHEADTMLEHIREAK